MKRFSRCCFSSSVSPAPNAVAEIHSRRLPAVALDPGKQAGGEDGVRHSREFGHAAEQPADAAEGVVQGAVQPTAKVGQRGPVRAVRVGQLGQMIDQFVLPLAVTHAAPSFSRSGMWLSLRIFFRRENSSPRPALTALRSRPPSIRPIDWSKAFLAARSKGVPVPAVDARSEVRAVGGEGDEQFAEWRSSRDQ